MKKSIIFCLCMAVVVMFTSCNKDHDGIYNPSKKIQKVYTVENGERQLAEVWNWNGNLLNTIESYEDGSNSATCRFYYTDNLLISISKGRSGANFNYEGKKVHYIEVDYYTPSGEKVSVADYYFNYNGSKLTQIKIIDYVSLEDKESQLNPLKYVIPQNYAEIENIVEKCMKEAKGEVNITMNLNWKGKNVTSVEIIQNSVSSAQTTSITYLTENTFDNQKNPLKCFLAGLFEVTEVNNMYYNQNNILTSTTKEGNVVINSTKNVYEYEDEYPVKVTSTTSYPDETEKVETYIYEY